MEKKERGFMSVCSTEDLCSVRWVDNKVVTVVSNQMTEAPTSKCKRYSKVQKCKIDVPQSHLIGKYNAYMGGVDQLDGYLNNLRSCIGGKKWYWMQFINLVRLLQVSAFFATITQKKRFHSWSLYELLYINVLGLIAKPKDGMSAFRIWCPRVLMNITWQNSQGRCKFCQKNCRLIC